MKRLKLTLPKGSLERATFELFNCAFYKISGQERTYRPMINDPDIELKILRPQEIPEYVATGIHDAGITGLDWIVETRAEVEKLLDLEFGKVEIVSAVPKELDKPIDSFFEEKWSNGLAVRISTEYLNIASEYLKALQSYKKRFGNLEPTVITPWWMKGSNPLALIFLSFGATEAKPPEDADAIIDVVETGLTLEQNNLKVEDTIMSSSAYLITNKQALSDTWKREKLYDLVALLRGVIEARKKIHIFVNVQKDNLNALLKILPSLKGPTISPLSKEGWYAVNTVVNKSELISIIPKLRKLAQGLVIHNPEQVLSLEEMWGNSNN